IQKIQKLEAPSTPASLAETILKGAADVSESPLLVRSTWRRREANIESDLSMHEMMPRPIQESSPGMAQPGLRPPCIQSFWQMGDGRADTLLSINTFECGSLAIAHEFLLVLLAEFESPLITRRPDAALGDVVFAGPEDFMMLFTRANLIHLVRNVGRDVVNVNDVASQLDKNLTARPKQVETAVPRLRSRATASALRPLRIETKVGVSAPLNLETLGTPLADAQRLTRAFGLDELPRVRSESQIMYKVFSAKSVEVFSDKEQLMVLPQKKGQQDITVYAVDIARNTVATEVQVIAK
ncbi:MAG TPA: hypothetical protein VEW46_23095, partial [Pyrinomonadaceae bacterium]|nr:hypothetical protein [Pyrinomonadaceae bacterium]